MVLVWPGKAKGCNSKAITDGQSVVNGCSAQQRDNWTKWIIYA